MRLLGLMLCCFGMSWFSLANADSDCDSESTETKEILKCISDSYKRVDRKLNAQYKALVSNHQIQNKKLLLEGQRAWIKFRDSNCSDYRSSSLGGESKIEEVGCLVSLTSSRLVELIYLETGTVGDGFYSLLSVTGGISSKTRDEIVSYVEDMDRTSDEIEYYKKIVS
ncbi:lysozyme inhibitor LprI family protein [Pseudomonas sp. GL-RE-26]|uniref:lysozyme inhibitor LprI family protein n=1 Tax=Pseudomonas sp. GL-RE-26 TaxID=2832390 RepID=UPI001CBAFB81|nr:lysozyme inhibitor LprI family protein [Pseudomonas sp. GL-RE-26]